jgi:hypothetical protein
MKKLCICIAALIGGLLSAFPGPAISQSVDVEGFIRQSTVIFKGRVEKERASNLKLLPASDQTVVVRVEDVLYAAKTLTDLKDQQVTVEMKEPNSLKAGDRATFFTTGWMYGENVALREVAHASAEMNSESLMKQIGDVQNRESDEKLQRRIRQAKLVIAGQVLKTQRFNGEGNVKSNSEHDPDWWTAEIGVESYLKGQTVTARGPVTVLFANSRDVMWLRSPKLKEGQHGIWIVTEYKPGGLFPRAGRPLLAVLSPLDAHLPNELEHIGRLVRSTQ